jgi:hypothetical protein
LTRNRIEQITKTQFSAVIGGVVECPIAVPQGNLASDVVDRKILAYGVCPSTDNRTVLGQL